MSLAGRVVQIVSREVGRPSSYVLRALELPRATIVSRELGLPSCSDRFKVTWLAEWLRSLHVSLADRVVKIISWELCWSSG